MLNNSSSVVEQWSLELSHHIVTCGNVQQHVKWKNGKAKPNEAYCPTAIEHLANILTHGIAIIPCIAGTTNLCWLSHDFWHFFSALIYGGTLVFLFSISTCFHWVFFTNHKCQLKNTLHRCDRAMIYIFIAGSYFPWLILCPATQQGWVEPMRWIIWPLAFTGITYQQVYHEQYKSLETCLYLLIGAVPAGIIISEVDPGAMNELFIGGIFYMIGVAFFKSDGFIPCAHAIWHVFVVIGAGVHYYAILTHLYHNKLPLSGSGRGFEF